MVDLSSWEHNMAIVDDLQLKIRSFKPSIKPLIKYIRKTNNEIVAIDRGYTTDTYTSKVNYRLQDFDIKELKRFVRDNLEMVFDKLPLNIFGEHLDHTQVDVVVLSIENLNNSSKNNSTFNVVYQLKTPFTFNSFSPGLPNLKCLNSGWSVKSKNNYKVISSYDNHFWVSESDLDILTFKGLYSLNRESLGRLLYFWLVERRGMSIHINDGDFGVFDMFGDGEIDHNIFINTISIEYVGVDTYKVNIETQKVA